MRRVRNRWGEPVFKFVACILQHARDRYYIAGDDDSWLDIPYWVCHRCGDKHKLCGACAPAPAPVKCAELQKPWWFVSHWYGRRCSPLRLAEPRTCR